jgi:hypothetical protein
MPTRLVHTTNERNHLVLTANLTSKPIYATLSHCWGTAEFFQLRCDNEQLLRESIPHHELPTTFKDALWFVRSLGLEYIWIDSLCIVQDDERDWEREAGRMSSVYGGSYVNIAASDAESVQEGLYANADSSACGFRAEVSTLRSGVHATRLLQFEVPDFDHCAMWFSHLATRAWAFQEKMLSPRTVHFCRIGIVWECAGGKFTDSLPEGHLHQSKDDDSRGLLERYRQMESLREWWGEAVRWYTAADTTNPRDRLPAISGVSRRLHERFQTDYAAGMWYDESIETQLCWLVHHQFALHPRPSYRAPSWSWASIDSTVALIYHTPGEKKYSHVLRIQTTPSPGHDTFGDLEDGSVRISCSFLLSGQAISRERVLIHSDNGDFHLTCFVDCLEVCGVDKSQPCWILPLLGFDRPRGLLLSHTGISRGWFRRIGTFVVCNEEELDRFAHALDKDGRAIASSQCAEIIENAKHPGESFVIMIV